MHRRECLLHVLGRTERVCRNAHRETHGPKRSKKTSHGETLWRVPPPHMAFLPRGGACFARMWAEFPSAVPGTCVAPERGVFRENSSQSSADAGSAGIMMRGGGSACGEAAHARENGRKQVSENTTGAISVNPIGFGAGGRGGRSATSWPCGLRKLGLPSGSSTFKKSRSAMP